MAKKILRLIQVKEKTGLSTSAIYLLMSGDEFPQSINIGVRTVGWIESEIDDWIEQRIQESRKSA